MIVDRVVYMRVLIIITPVLDTHQRYLLSFMLDMGLPTIASNTPGNRHSQLVFGLSCWLHPFSRVKEQSG